MRICLLTTTFLPQIGGAEYMVHHTAKCLAEFGHQVTVLAPKYKNMTDEIGPNYRIQRYQIPPRQFLFNQYLFMQLSLEKMKTKFDILHAVMMYPAGYCSAKFKKLFNIPVVVTPQGAGIQIMPEIGYGFRLNPKIDKKVKWAVQNVDAITAISNSIKQDIINAGANEEKIYDIPNGVDTSRFKKPTRNVREMFGLSINDKVILSVGRNHPKKGYSDMLKALPNVLKEFPNTKYIIVGYGTDSLIPLIRELKIEKSVILAGPIPKRKSEFTITNIPHNDLMSIYLTSDVFVMPSLIEGFGVVLVEAMAAGLPIVATDVPGIRDVIQEEITGFLVPPADPERLAEKIILLLKNDSLRKTISQNCKLMSEKYDWQVIAKKFITAYEEVSKSNK